jgi:hypothetical protein
MTALARYVRQHHVALLALTLVLAGGTAYAATVHLPKNSVASKQVRNNALQGKDLRDGTVTGADLGTGAVGAVNVTTAPTTCSLRGELVITDKTGAQAPRPSGSRTARAVCSSSGAATCAVD